MYTSLLQMLHPAAQTASAASSAASPSATDPGVDLTNTFMQLLTVQLKNQSPLNPLDPNAFVTQLATFDSLGELTQIQELMQTLVNDVRSPSRSGADANSSANSTSTPSLNSVSH